MKNLLLIVLLFTTVFLKGQTFDFHNQKLLDNESGYVSNKNFTLSITNVNTFKYDVVIDNQFINNNIEKPDIFDSSFKEFEKIAKQGLLNKQLLAVSDINDLLQLFLNLQSCLQFQESLVELVSSNQSPENIIEMKRGYLFLYTGISGVDDKLDVPSIIKYYSSIITRIKLSAPEIKEKATTTEEKEKVDEIINETVGIFNVRSHYQLASFYNSINEQKFTVNKFIKKPNADDIIVNVTLSPNAEFSNEKMIKSVEIPLLVNGGVKIDFSTGIFVSNLVDDVYLNKPNYENGSITSYNLIKEDENPIGYGLAGYMHTYWRTHKDFNVALSLGVGIDQNTQVKIMPGLSLIVGRKERLVINAGFAFGKVKQLSKEQDTERLYSSKIDPIYSEPYKLGWSVGISYNLFK